MLEQLKVLVCEANLRLVEVGLVISTFGNVSGLDRDGRRVVIKPSGVAYARMRPEHMTVVSLDDGQILEGDLRPSSDTPTHLEIYRAFPGIGGVVHTHSVYATAWAQACRDIPPLGTTHADYFHGPVPCSRPLSSVEIAHDYERNTGTVIVERLQGMQIEESPGVLVAHHGPFAWGANPSEAVEHAVILEYLARLAAETIALRPGAIEMPRELLDRHFLRKHGAGRYYGQRGSG